MSSSFYVKPTNRSQIFSQSLFIILRSVGLFAVSLARSKSLISSAFVIDLSYKPIMLNSKASTLIRNFLLFSCLSMSGLCHCCFLISNSLFLISCSALTFSLWHACSAKTSSREIPCPACLYYSIFLRCWTSASCCSMSSHMTYL